MSEQPSLPPFDPRPITTTVRPGGAFGIVLSWLVIAVSIGLLFYKRQSADESAMLPADPANQIIDFQVRFLGRYVVGLNRILPEAQRETTVKQVLEQFSRAVKSPADQLRAAIVTAEVNGGDAALEVLDEIDVSESESLRPDAQTLREIWGQQNADEARLHPDARTELVAHHGWFGRLALTWRLPEANALRREALAPAIRTAVTGMTLGVAALGFGFVGLVLLIVAIILFATGILRRAYVAPARPAGALLEAFAVYMALYIGLGLLAGRVNDSNISRALVIAALGAPLVAALWPLARGWNWRDLKFGLGWHTGRGLFREIGAGIVGYLAGIPIVFLGIGITFWIMRHTGAAPSHPIVNQVSSDAVRVLKLLCLASIYAPLVEETMFRGALYSHLRRKIVWPVAAIVVAFIFAAIHPQGWAGVPALMGLAFVFAAMREWRSSLVAPMTAHALNNAILVFALVLMAG